MSKRAVLVPLFALLLTCLFCSAAFADALTPEKLADTKKMLEASETGAIGEQLAGEMTEQLVEVLHVSRPELDAKTLGVVRRELHAFLIEKITAPGGLLDRLTPIYAKHFTHAEIKQILAFYQSATGKKVLATFPQLLHESQAASLAYSKEIAPELRQRILNALQKENAAAAKQPTRPAIGK